MTSLSAVELVKQSLRLIGVLPEGESLQAETLQISLLALNTLVDLWANEGLMLFSTTDRVYSWPSNTTTISMGPTGDFVTDRPENLDQSTYFVIGGISYRVVFINEDSYNSIGVKGLVGGLPYYLFVNNTFPNLTLKTYPTSSSPLTWHFISKTELQNIQNGSDIISLPKGYLYTFIKNLALELSSVFGVPPSPQLVMDARNSKAVLKRKNSSPNLMTIDINIPGPFGYYDIYSGLII